MRRTLASRGFLLPATPPKVGILMFDQGEWNAPNLRKTVLDFLEPGNSFKVGNRPDLEPCGRIIDEAAALDGFGDRMYRAMGNPTLRAHVAEWLGVSPHLIWPRHFAPKAARAPAHFSPWRRWKAATRDLLRFWWGIVA